MLASKASDKDVPQDAYLLVFMLTMATPGSPYVGTELKLPESAAKVSGEGDAQKITVDFNAGTFTKDGKDIPDPLKARMPSSSATSTPSDSSSSSATSSDNDRNVVLIKENGSWKIDLSKSITG